jgi:hypothetical protein
MLPELTQYVLCHGYDTTSRSAAASCIHAIITLGGRNRPACPVKPLVLDIVNPTIASAIDIISVKDCLNILALMVSKPQGYIRFLPDRYCTDNSLSFHSQGSAAACRGGSSSSTAANIATFLAEMACTGKSSLPFSSDEEAQLVSSKFDGADVLSSLEITAASAYGSILSVETAKPLMKQRLAHISLRLIRSAYEEQRDQATSGKTVEELRVGTIAVVCHVVCSTDISKTDKWALQKMATLAVEGLSSSIFLTDDGIAQRSSSSAKNLILASVLKLVCVAPTSVRLILEHCDTVSPLSIFLFAYTLVVSMSR